MAEVQVITPLQMTSVLMLDFSTIVLNASHLVYITSTEYLGREANLHKPRQF